MLTAGATIDLVHVVTWLGHGEAPWAPLRDLDWLAWRGAAPWITLQPRFIRFAFDLAAKFQSVKHTADRGLEAALCGASARLNC